LNHFLFVFLMNFEELFARAWILTNYKSGRHRALFRFWNLLGKLINLGLQLVFLQLLLADNYLFLLAINNSLSQSFLGIP
jgi:hypothetical protein